MAQLPGWGHHIQIPLDTDPVSKVKIMAGEHPWLAGQLYSWTAGQLGHWDAEPELLQWQCAECKSSNNDHSPSFKCSKIGTMKSAVVQKYVLMLCKVLK